MKPHRIAPVLQVADLERALRYYVDVLGFQQAFRTDDYAGICMGGIEMNLCAHDVHGRPVGGGAAYVIADEVDEYHAAITARGARIKVAPADWFYGLRDFTVLDPDGNHLTFGCEVNRTG